LTKLAIVKRRRDVVIDTALRHVQTIPQAGRDCLSASGNLAGPCAMVCPVYRPPTHFRHFSKACAKFRLAYVFIQGQF
jgi:hypothetical protein